MDRHDAENIIQEYSKEDVKYIANFILKYGKSGLKNFLV